MSEITVPHFTAGQTVRIGYKPYTFGTVINYALRNRKDPIASIDEARAKGEPLAWMSADAVVMDGTKLVAPEIVFGDLVELDGRFYYVKRPGAMDGDHPNLVPATNVTGNRHSASVDGALYNRRITVENLISRKGQS